MDINSKALFNNTIIYAIGNFGSKLLSFGLLPIFSYYLTKEEFGYYDIVVTTITLLIPLITLQLSDAVFRWLIVSDGSIKLIQKTITNTFAIVGLNILFFILLGLFSFFFIELKSKYLILILLATSTIFPVLQQTVRGLQRSKLFAASGLIYSFILLLMNLILLLVFKLSIDALFIASICANLLSSLYIFFKTKLFKFIDFELFSFSEVKELLKYSAPLIPNTISWWLIISANKYIILYFLGKEALGVFGFSNRFPGLLVIINSIFIMAWQESAILNFNKKGGKEFFSKVFDYLIIIQFSFAILLILTSEILVKYFISEEFYESWQYMPILYLGAAFSTLAGFYGSMYIGSKDTKASLSTSVVSGGINVFLAFILVKPFGLYGVSFANTFSFMFLFLHRYKHTQKYMLLNFTKKKLILILFLVFTSFIVVYQKSIAVSFITVLLMVPILVVLNKQLFFTLINHFKQKLYGISKL